MQFMQMYLRGSKMAPESPNGFCKVHYLKNALPYSVTVFTFV